MYRLMDQWCEAKVPFLFLIDYEQKKPLLFKLAELENNNSLWVDFPGFGNTTKENSEKQAIEIEKNPLSLEEYQLIYNFVQAQLHFGNSYLTNLTFETPIEISLDLKEIFKIAKAKYKLYYNNEFVCFSPETFIKIENQKISTYPMKGTIDANLPDAVQKLLSNEKENAEHATVVDLLRNDLSMVAQNVSVEKFRYIEKLKTNKGDILQSSSKITGDLNEEFHEAYGTVLEKMLPAGSITGAPKEATVKIISEAENYDRGYYTGVMGIFDGVNLESAVMIRFLELKNNEYFYKSGGGITALSQVEDEYEEMLNKIYVPIF